MLYNKNTLRKQGMHLENLIAADTSPTDCAMI